MCSGWPKFPYKKSVSVHPVHGNPRTGLLRTFWEPDRVLRSPFRGLCVQGGQNFPPKISRHFSRDVLQLQMPNFMAFFILQTFVLDFSETLFSRRATLTHGCKIAGVELPEFPQREAQMLVE